MQYFPLDPSKNEIRLIELLPAANAQRELTPRCRLFHVSLKENPAFRAISYVWGNPRDNIDIVVNDVSVPVTLNLYSAMQQLYSEKSAKPIWIYSLCINQFDEEEKGSQVKLMREIYQSADHVSVWLGPANATRDGVMDYLNSLGTKAMRFGLDDGPDLVRKHWRKLASHPLSFRDTSMSRVMVISSNATPDSGLVFPLAPLNELYYSISGWHEQDNLLQIDGIVSLFTRPGWSRTWVLQEISVARKAGFLCGAKKLSRRRCTGAFNATMALRTILQEAGILKGWEPTAYQKAVTKLSFDHRPNVMLSI